MMHAPVDVRALAPSYKGEGKHRHGDEARITAQAQARHGRSAESIATSFAAL